MQRPANLAVVVLDNERYGETGMQANGAYLKDRFRAALLGEDALR